MRMIPAAILALTLSASQVLAGGAATPTNAPLPAGKPAGVKAADLASVPWTVFLAVGLVGIGIGLAASQKGNQGVLAATATTP